MDSVTPDILPPSVRVRTDGRSSAEQFVVEVQGRPHVREVVEYHSAPEGLGLSPLPGPDVDATGRDDCAGFPDS